MPPGKDSAVSSSSGTSPPEPSHIPLVTIGMPVRNGAQYLEEAIASLQAQTEGDFILHISDNCSDDATPEICARLAAEDLRIHYERQERNLGMVGNFNYLLRLARTPFFMWVAHDDLRAPTFLATSLKLLHTAPDAVACSAGVRIIDETGTETDFVLPAPGLASSRPIDRAHAVTRYGAWPIYGLIRREALPAYARLGDHLGADIAFAFTMVLNRRMVVTDEILTTYRLADVTLKLGGSEARLYNYSRIPTQMYRSMARDIDRSSLHASVKTQLWIHVVGQWLARARWTNLRAIRRARTAHDYGTMILRVPAQLVLGPGRSAYRFAAWLRRQITAAIHR